MRSLCLSNFRGRDMSRAAQARQPSSFLKFQPAQSASPSKWWIKLCQHIRMGAESSRTQARVKFRPELSRIKVRAPRRVSNILTNGRFTRLIKKWKGGGINNRSCEISATIAECCSIDACLLYTSDAADE